MQHRDLLAGSESRAPCSNAQKCYFPPAIQTPASGYEAQFCLATPPFPPPHTHIQLTHTIASVHALAQRYQPSILRPLDPQRGDTRHSHPLLLQAPLPRPRQPYHTPTKIHRRPNPATAVPTCAQGHAQRCHTSPCTGSPFRFWPSTVRQRQARAPDQVAAAMPLFLPSQTRMS